MRQSARITAAVLLAGAPHMLAARSVGWGHRGALKAVQSWRASALGWWQQRWEVLPMLVLAAVAAS